MLSSWSSPTSETFACRCARHGGRVRHVRARSETPVIVCGDHWPAGQRRSSASCWPATSARPSTLLRLATQVHCRGRSRRAASPKLMGERRDELAMLARGFRCDGRAAARRCSSRASSCCATCRTSCARRWRGCRSRWASRGGPGADLDAGARSHRARGAAARRADRRDPEPVPPRRSGAPAATSSRSTLDELLESLWRQMPAWRPSWRRAHRPAACTPGLALRGDRELLHRARREHRPQRHPLLAGRRPRLDDRRGRRRRGIVHDPRPGPGVPADLLGRIFEPFFRVGSARDRDSGGNGIGLAITARVLEACTTARGAAQCDSGGLQVELRFPTALA